MNCLNIFLVSSHTPFILFFTYFREGNFGNAIDHNGSLITSIDSILDEHAFEWHKQLSQLCQTISANTTNNYNAENNFLAFEELMDLVSSTSSTFLSTAAQTNENVDMLDDKLERQSVSELTFSCVKNKRQLLRHSSMWETILKFLSYSIQLDYYHHRNKVLKWLCNFDHFKYFLILLNIIYDCCDKW